MERVVSSSEDPVEGGYEHGFGNRVDRMEAMLMPRRKSSLLVLLGVLLLPKSFGFSSVYRRATQPSDLASNDVSWQTLVGQGDRAFKLGTLLEKNGQYRKASSSFHEAATLYQCYLENEKDFCHVTELTRLGCIEILSYTLLRLGFLNLDCLGDPRAAIRLYREAACIDPVPSAAAFEGTANAIEASGGPLEDALYNYQRAMELHPAIRRTQFRAAVLMDRLGRDQQAAEIMETLRRDDAQYSCLVDSWGYVRWHTRKMTNVNLSRGTRDMLEVALTAAMPLVEQGGLVCEFGVGSGRSIRMTQEILPLNVPIHGFDTFRYVGKRQCVHVSVCEWLHS